MFAVAGEVVFGDEGCEFPPGYGPLFASIISPEDVLISETWQAGEDIDWEAYREREVWVRSVDRAKEILLNPSLIEQARAEASES